AHTAIAWYRRPAWAVGRGVPVRQCGDRLMGAVQLTGAFALLLSFALLYQRRGGVALRICTMQGVAAGLVVAIQAWTHASVQAGLIAVFAGLLNGVAMPLVLRYLSDRSGANLTRQRDNGVYASVG